jgi:dTDP-glucose 4,6-dehydratase
MRLLVTGGAGFIGSNFVRLALESGHSVHNLDALTYAGRRENLADIASSPRYQFTHGDICSSELVRQIMKREAFDAVVNFAAESHVDRSLNDAAAFARTNTLGVAVLVEASYEHKIPIFIQISTDEVYGSTTSGSFTLTSPLKPSSPYSSSKAGGDLVALSFFHSFGYDVRVTRSTNNFGPYQFPEKFIPVVITKALRGENIPIYGDGLYIRDWIFVRDHCEGILDILTKGKAGKIYHFSGGYEMTNIALCERILSYIAERTGKDFETLKSLMTSVTDRAGHDRRYSLDHSETTASIGWKPRSAFDKAITETIDWYLKNEQWLAAVI